MTRPPTLNPQNPCKHVNRKKSSTVNFDVIADGLRQAHYRALDRNIGISSQNINNPLTIDLAASKSILVADIGKGIDQKS